MTSAALPEDESIDLSIQLQNQETEFPIPIPHEVTPAANLEANPVLQQVLLIEQQQAPIPYQGEPLQAPSIVPQVQEKADLSFPHTRHRPAPATNTTDVMQRYWLFVLGTAVIAVVFVSGLRSQNAPPQRPIPPTRIPQTGAW
ncbi:MAG TPA: hypothetical protein V6D10_02630 [Trichocoleus sp.]|jgi:hypothetical protein